MRKSARVIVSVCAWAFAGAASARAPILVELFTAQGCASCGAADTLVGRLADRSDIIALTWSVDYWDYLGWKDTFAKPEFTDRQRAYDKRFGLRDVYTPQLIVGGAAQAPGDKTAAVDALVDAARRQTSLGPKVRFASHGRVTVGPGARPPGGGDVWLIRYDPREQAVAIKDGDNRGKTVVRRDVVRDFVRLGGWRGAWVSFKLPSTSTAGLAQVVVVQGSHGGRVLAVARSVGG